MQFPTFRLDNRVALVTGAAQGIGRAIALGLANAGATVAITDLAADGLAVVGKELDDLGKPGLQLVGDVSRPDEIGKLVDQVIAKFGQLDVLVNNAGVRVHKRVLDHTVEDWDYSFRVNCTSALLFSQAAARFMRDHKGGSIINISSNMVEVTHPYRIAYCTSKAAVLQMTRVMAVDWAEYNIRVNTIGPGATKTPFTVAAVASGALPISTETMLLGRMAEAEEMVGAVIYLASDASSYVTGSLIKVDGGQSVTWGLT